MDLLTWIRTPDPSVEIIFDTELGERLRQIFKATPDYFLLFSNPDFVSLLAQYSYIQSQQLNVPANILISQEFIKDDVSSLSKFGINYKFTSNGVIHCELSTFTPTWLADWDVFKGVLSSTTVRPDWSVGIDPVIFHKSKFCSYRSLAQRSMLRAAERLDPGDTLFSILPTSAGKSLLTHASFMDHKFEGGVTICVVPTIALAIDQERQLIEFCQRNNIDISQRVFAWRSGLSDPLKKSIKQAVSNGTQGILFASPEALTSSLLPSLMRCARNGFLKTFIIDEAHLIVQWGDEFRPAFQTISGMRKALLEKCPEGKKFKTHLLTATLCSTSHEVLKHLFPGEQETYLINARLLRQEPTYHFKKLESKEEKFRKFTQLIYTLPRPSIVYTTVKLHAAELYKLARDLGFKRVACFTGDTPDIERQRILEKWRQCELDLVVATSAFGVGIDNNSVRNVIHVGLPETLDRYYQEAGRAGRDGRVSSSTILFDEADVDTARNMAVPSYLTEENAFQRWRTMYQNAQNLANDTFLLDTGLVPSNLQQDTDYNRNWNLRTLTMMTRAGLIELSSIEPAALGLNTGDLASEELINEHELWLTYFRSQKIKLIDPQVNDQQYFDVKIASSRNESKKMHLRQYQLFEDYLNLDADLGDSLARLYSYSAEGAALDVLPTCRGCEYCNGKEDRINNYQHVAPRINFKNHLVETNLDSVLDLENDPIIYSHNHLDTNKITQLIEKLSVLFPIYEIVSDTVWIRQIFWHEIYPKLRRKSLFVTGIDDFIDYQQIINVPSLFVCTQEISQQQFTQFLTIEKDISLFLMLEDRKHPYLKYRNFIENSTNKIDYSNFVSRLSQ